MGDETVKFTINGKEVEVPKGTTVYTAATQLGIDIPIFCYHDRMPPFGACRMCLVEVEKMPKLQTSCTLAATEGMVVKTHSEMAEKGRDEILELLLINHPLDCPICDRGGECPLQEQTLKFGPGKSRFYEEKRHFEKPLPLGPVLMLDRERCIVCARCTRFGDVVAGDHGLEFIERGYKTEVGTPGGRPVESKFIGNTIMLCPVGALTSQVYRFRARPWDNDSMETTCPLCPVGCSMYLDSRDGEIVRTQSRENKEVNDIWLCDKGWFGYEFAGHPERLKTPLIRHRDELEPASWEDAIALIGEKIKEYKGGGKIAGFGGTSLTTEGLYLFQQLMRQGAAVDHVDYRVGMPILSLEEEGLAPGMEMTIGECEELSFAVLLGLDLTEEFPVIWLRLKQAINKEAKVIFIGHFAPEISQHLAQIHLHSPGDEIENIREHLVKFISDHPGKKGAIFVGRQYLAAPHRKAVLAELLKIRNGTPNVSLNIMEGSGNSMGARIAGMHPEMGSKGGLNALQVIQKAAESGWDLLYVAGADPAKKFPTQLWKDVRANLGFLIVQDIFLTKTAQQADVVLPTLSYVEKKGSIINIEGRVQKVQPGKDIPPQLYSDADIFTLVGHKLNVSLKLGSAFAQTLKNGRIKPQLPERLDASKVESPTKNGLLATFACSLFDNGVRMEHNPQLIQLAKTPRIRLHPNEGAKRGIMNGDVVKLSTSEGSISVKVKLDAHVAEGTIVIPIGFESVPVQELGVNLLNGTSVELQREVQG